MLNKNLFKAKLIERGVTMGEIAQVIGCNEATVYRKLNGTSDFTRNEIQLVREALELTPQETESIFFAQQLA